MDEKQQKNNRIAAGHAGYLWTQHARMKMKYYRLTESRIIRIIRHPARVEEGILEGAIAAMQPANGSGDARPGRRSAGGGTYSEIWMMYMIENSKGKNKNTTLQNGIIQNAGYQKFLEKTQSVAQKGMIKIITAWRYPGKSPERNPIPEDVLREVRALL